MRNCFGNRKARGGWTMIRGKGLDPRLSSLNLVPAPSPRRVCSSPSLSPPRRSPRASVFLSSGLRVEAWAKERGWYCKTNMNYNNFLFLLNFSWRNLMCAAAAITRKLIRHPCCVWSLHNAQIAAVSYNWFTCFYIIVNNESGVLTHYWLVRDRSLFIAWGGGRGGFSAKDSKI